MQSILSGPIALLGTSSRNSLMIEQDRINAAGGFLGRPIEFVFRDSKGQPQEAARIARQLVNTTGCELLVDAEASSASFAVQEVVRDFGIADCSKRSFESSAH
ncbi:MAG: ABC transporter substrate-binding protein [Xanthobacteraceae bacterium]